MIKSPVCIDIELYFTDVLKRVHKGGRTRWLIQLLARFKDTRKHKAKQRAASNKLYASNLKALRPEKGDNLSLPQISAFRLNSKLIPFICLLLIFRLQFSPKSR